MSAVIAEEAGRYIHWGVIQISVTNLAIIVIMLVLFAFALLLPFPRPKDEPTERRS
jgi:hypothetical protein